MDEIEPRTIANMDVVLEEVCRSLLHGGDHESRKFVARKLMQAAKTGNVTLDGLRLAGRRAFSELSRPKPGSRRPSEVREAPTHDREGASQNKGL
jgi:hypothetical protein